MSKKKSRRQFLAAVSISTASAAVSGCGTLMHPERVGRPHSGAIDWKIAALDGLGLLLFFVPGVIAFAVDFYNGTIYLPHHGYGAMPQKQKEDLVQVQIPKKDLNRDRIQNVVSDHVGESIALADGQYHTTPLDDINHFWSTETRVRQQVTAS